MTRDEILVSKDSLIPGKTYCIFIEDCCVVAELDAEFVRAEEDGKLIFKEIVFERAYDSAVSFYEIIYND